MKKLGLYIHIPFCKSKCIYCDFYSLPGCGDEVKAAYRSALRRHMELEAARCRQHSVDTVFFGGGTPSVMGHEMLADILGAVKENFQLVDDAEITLEANPESSDEQFLRQVKRAGFNRISFGVQSFDDTQLRRLGRIHSARQAVSTVNAAAENGFEQISIDLMYALPGQSMEDWLSTLEQAVKLPITHISCYGLRPEESTPLISSPLMQLIPDDDAQADMYLMAVEKLDKAGFQQYEISNFAKPGCACRHNMKYWQLEEYLGFGPGAASDFDGARTTVSSNLKTYLECCPPLLSEKDCPAPEERLRERVMLSLRTREGLLLDREEFAPLAELLSQEKLGIIESGRFHLTPEGFLLSNRIIRQFWELLP